jgi:hypothetical protein
MERLASVKQHATLTVQADDRETAMQIALHTDVMTWITTVLTNEENRINHVVKIDK